MKKLKYERPIIKSIKPGIPNKFGLKSMTTPITHIDGVAVKDLVKEYGSPVYVVSESTLRETYQEAYQVFV